MIILRIIAGFLTVAFLSFYVLLSVMTNDWLDKIGTIFIITPLFMYALRGNNWQLKWYPHLVKNVFKKNDGNDDYTSIDLSWFKKVFRKKKQ